jgi:hypothetical protein
VRARRPGRASTISGTFGLEKLLRLGIGREVQTFAEAIECERGGGGRVASARSLVDTLRAQDAELMLILDDTADQAIERVRVKLADEVGAGDCGPFTSPLPDSNRRPPPYICASFGNWSQPPATVVVCFRRFRAQSIRH